MLDPPASHVDGPSVVQVKHDSPVLFGLPTKLTLRQQEILLLMRKGLCNKEIAERLQIKIQTVRNHAHTREEKRGRKTEEKQKKNGDILHFQGQ